MLCCCAIKPILKLCHPRHIFSRAQKAFIEDITLHNCYSEKKEVMKTSVDSDHVHAPKAVR